MISIGAVYRKWFYSCYWIDNVSGMNLSLALKLRLQKDRSNGGKWTLSLLGSAPSVTAKVRPPGVATILARFVPWKRWAWPSVLSEGSSWSSTFPHIWLFLIILLDLVSTHQDQSKTKATKLVFYVWTLKLFQQAGITAKAIRWISERENWLREQRL